MQVDCRYFAADLTGPKGRYVLSSKDVCVAKTVVCIFTKFFWPLICLVFECRISFFSGGEESK